MKKKRTRTGDTALHRQRIKTVGELKQALSLLTDETPLRPFHGCLLQLRILPDKSKRFIGLLGGLRTDDQFTDLNVSHERKRQLRQEAKGLCISGGCHEEALPDRILCAACTQARSAINKRSYLKRKALKTKKGLCVYATCQKKAQPNHLLCKRHGRLQRKGSSTPIHHGSTSASLPRTANAGTIGATCNESRTTSAVRNMKQSNCFPRKAD